jgi:hypothetical protein
MCYTDDTSTFIPPQFDQQMAQKYLTQPPTRAHSIHFGANGAPTQNMQRTNQPYLMMNPQQYNRVSMPPYNSYDVEV